MHVFAVILAAAMATATPHSAMQSHSMMSSHHSMKSSHTMKSNAMHSNAMSGHMTTHMAKPKPTATP